MRLKIFWRHWRNVPERYRDVRLKTLAPSTAVRMPLPAQAAMISLVKANLGKSMMLYGPAKTGKTHIALAIYRDACAESAIRLRRSLGEGGFATWRVNTSVWLEDVIRWETRDKKDDEIEPPAFTEKSIETAAKAGVRPRVFLEEIDKFKVSEYKLIRLFEIVNAIYEAKGRIVATSNTSVEELAAEWGAKYGETILRRIGDEPEGMTLRFTAG